MKIAPPLLEKKYDEIGQNSLHCYIEDEDQGGSWNGIKDYLCHIHPEGSVKGLYWDKQKDEIQLPSESYDQVIICEDGLWSGLEATRRMNALKNSDTKSSVRFKYCAVTDFGLRITRHWIRENKAQNFFSIDATGAQLKEVISDELPAQLMHGKGLSTDDYFQELHKYIDPLCFKQQDSKLRDACEDIGSQLITHWLTKKYGKSPSRGEINKFALGGGRFASATVFTKSIPKVCPPVFWLNGPIKYNGLNMDWKPLFADSRRVSNIGLLYDK